MLNKYQLSELVKKKIIVYVEGDQTQRMHKNFIVEFQACGWELGSGKNQHKRKK